MQRTNRFCGLKNEQPLPSQAGAEACFLNKTGDGLLAFELCVENEIHANLHGVHGGYWDCPADLDAFADAAQTVAAEQCPFHRDHRRERADQAAEGLRLRAVPGRVRARRRRRGDVPLLEHRAERDELQRHAGLRVPRDRLEAASSTRATRAHAMTLSPVTGEHAFAGPAAEQDSVEASGSTSSCCRLPLRRVAAGRRARSSPLFWPMRPSSTR